MEVVVFLIKEGFPLPIFITENQHLNLNHSICPRTTRFNISQHKPIQPPSQKKTIQPYAKEVRITMNSIFAPYQSFWKLLSTYNAPLKIGTLNPAKKWYFKRGYSICGNWRATASKSFTCGPDHQLLRIKLSRELTIPTKVRSTTYPVPANAAIVHLGF